MRMTPVLFNRSYCDNASQLNSNFIMELISSNVLNNAHYFSKDKIAASFHQQLKIDSRIVIIFYFNFFNAQYKYIKNDCRHEMYLNKLANKKTI